MTKYLINEGGNSTKIKKMRNENKKKNCDKGVNDVKYGI